MADFAALIGPWVAIVALMLGIVNTVAQWIGRPGKELKAEVKCLEDETEQRFKEQEERHKVAMKSLEDQCNERFKEHDRRIQKQEDAAPHAPTKEDLHSLDVRLASLNTSMGALQKTVDRMDRHLREGGQ